MPQDLTKWDIRPKQGNGTLPMTIFVEGYLTPLGYPANYPVDDNQTIILQIDWGGGDFHDTILSMVTHPDSSTGTLYHGYFSGTVDLVAEGGNGIWIYAPGVNDFRVRYAGNSILEAVTSPIISVVSASLAHAFIDAIRQLDSATSIWYSLFPEGQQGYCNVGAVCWINMRLRNNGNGMGSIYVKITRGDTGAVVWNQSYTLAENAYVDIDQINFVMPDVDLTLTFEIGHT